VGLAAVGIESPARRDATDARHVPVDRPPSELCEWRVRNRGATKPLATCGYHAINVVFAYLPIVYALAASQPHWLLR
jgi:hypothetical protein